MSKKKPELVKKMEDFPHAFLSAHAEVNELSIFVKDHKSHKYTHLRYALPVGTEVKRIENASVTTKIGDTEKSQPIGTLCFVLNEENVPFSIRRNIDKYELAKLLGIDKRKL